MSKIKVLTIQFDVTNLSPNAIASLQDAVAVQAEEFEIGDSGLYEFDVPVLNTSIRELETENDS